MVTLGLAFRWNYPLAWILEKNRVPHGTLQKWPFWTFRSYLFILFKWSPKMVTHLFILFKWYFRPTGSSTFSTQKHQAALVQIDTPERAETGMQQGRGQESDVGGGNWRGEVSCLQLHPLTSKLFGICFDRFINWDHTTGIYGVIVYSVKYVTLRILCCIWMSCYHYIRVLTTLHYSPCRSKGWPATGNWLEDKTGAGSRVGGKVEYVVITLKNSSSTIGLSFEHLNIVHQHHLI